MKKKIVSSFIIAGIFAFNAVASDGVVRFYGSIVEEPCNVNMVKDNVSMKCGKNVESFKIGTKYKEIAKGKYVISEKVIDKNAKVLIVTYN